MTTGAGPLVSEGPARTGIARRPSPPPQGDPRSTTLASTSLRAGAPAGRAGSRPDVRATDGAAAGTGETVAIQRRALVLNQNYEPLNVCSVGRAFVLVLHGKADVLTEGEDPLIGAEDALYATPSVIRLRHFVRRPHPRPRLTRREVFQRDQERCQYCGRRGGDLTLDHVLPKHRGGPHVWENLVTACRECNHRKGGRTPQEARMELLKQPARPSTHPAVLFAPYLERYREWAQFVLGWGKAPPHTMAIDGADAAS
ncbi:MAG: HNH endonuclease [Chloroflexi bacterium]|nr:HNH endonuclease [Chloroflexota bacterium]